MIKCLIVDDEPIARKGMLQHFQNLENAEVVACCRNTVEAQAILNKEPVDLILLDIEMPNETGIEFVKKLKNPPLIIFTTAYSKYAIQGFDLHVLDFLLKPISFQRLKESLNKAEEYLLLKNSNSTKKAPYLFAKCDGRLMKIIVEEICHVAALGNYSIIHTLDKRYTVYSSLKHLLSELPSPRFMQIHKSYLANLELVEMFDLNKVLINGVKLPVSKTFKKDLLDQLSSGKI